MNNQNYPDGRDILNTLIELYAAQEKIKVNYEIIERSTKDERNTLPTPVRSA